MDALAGAAAAATLAAAGSGTRAASRDDEALAASRLSKPEREAFRKIAEALGGRSDTGDTRPVAEAPAADEHDASDLLAALDDAEADTAPVEALDETADDTPDGENAADADAGEAEDVRLDGTDEEPDGIDDDSAADDGEAAPAPVAPVPSRPI
ncbi:MAG: hypothetical protein HPM95_12465 [Alphaproteobacteria bacterium]|nr:hypothetical protein [Alphaproteobacteria bacterium]